MIYVFDLDGTLINSKKRHYLLMCYLLKKRNILLYPSFEQDYLNYKEEGKTNIDLLVNRMHLNSRLAHNIAKAWVRKIESNWWLKYDYLYEDALNTLNKCRVNDIGVVFLTSRCKKNNALKEIRKLGLFYYSKEIFVVNPSIKGSKAIILKQLKNNFSDIVMIGDTEIDFYAAEEACVPYYILNRGFRKKEFWEERGIISYDDLLSLPVWSKYEDRNIWRNRK